MTTGSTELIKFAFAHSGYESCYALATRCPVLTRLCCYQEDLRAARNDLQLIRAATGTPSRSPGPGSNMDSNLNRAHRDPVGRPQEPGWLQSVTDLTGQLWPNGHGLLPVAGSGPGPARGQLENNLKPQPASDHDTWGRRPTVQDLSRPPLGT